MSDTDRYIDGVPCWVDAMFPDVDAARAFYGGLFGWTFEETMPPEAPGSYLIASIDGASCAAIGPAGDGDETGWQTYVKVADADAATERARANGGSVLAEPMDVFDAGRMSVLGDPQGATIRTWQAGTTKGLERVNAHGSVVFNDLVTTDEAGAAEFYGAVFDWAMLDTGDDNGHFWTLAAYGDHLEARSPGNRAMMAEMGMPGFEAVVATVSASTDGGAQWGVTFAVDDIAATVAAARELGATATDPADGVFVRDSIITDPQGVRFVASQFVPENAPGA